MRAILWDSACGMALPRHNLSAGEFGVSLAHRNAYDQVLLNALPCAIVLENDASLGVGFAQLLYELSVPWRDVTSPIDPYRPSPRPTHKHPPDYDMDRPPPSRSTCSNWEVAPQHL